MKAPSAIPNGLHVERLDYLGVHRRLTMFQSLAAHGHNPTDDFKDTSEMLAGLDGPTLVAYAGFTCYHGHWTLRNCVVAPSHRGRGLQGSLIAERLKLIRCRGGRSVSVWVNPVNSYSLNNLVAAGFRFRHDKLRTFHGIAHVGLQVSLPTDDANDNV